MTVRSQEDLDPVKFIFDDDYYQNRPLTYVITTDEELHIGAWVNEHVAVARGEDVIAAGEIKFEKGEDGWTTTYMNNRSNGYFPATSCLHWLTNALDRAGIPHSGKWDYTHPREGCNDADFLSIHPLYQYHKS